jgi:hypothetical protein
MKEGQLISWKDGRRGRRRETIRLAQFPSGPLLMYILWKFL